MSLIKRVDGDPKQPTRQTGPAKTFGWTRASGLPLGTTDASAPDLTVPDRLRKAYEAAPKLSDRELLSWAHRALRMRADRANEAEKAAYAAAHEGRSLVTTDTPSERAVLDAGIQPADFDHAQHLQRLDVAERQVSARELSEQREKQRQAARCRSCGALDVQTKAPTGPATTTRALAPLGVVCAPCEVVAVARYVERLAAQPVDGKRTRGDAVRSYLAGAGK